MNRLLILSPAFHGIWQGVAASFQQLGYNVRAHLYDHNPTVLARAGYKLSRELPRYVGMDPEPRHRRSVTTRAVNVLRDTCPDAVLVIKGELLGRDFWDALDDSRARRLLWLYDDYRRVGFKPEFLERARTVASFSDSDVIRLRAQGVEAHYLPLGFDTGLVPVPATEASELVFAGARYPYRVHLLGALVAAGLPVRAYGREWSKHPIDRLRTWDPRRPHVPAGRELARPELYGLLAAAPAALNVHDGTQDGFNLRTFEACGVGGVQMTDRADVDRFYDVGSEVVVYRDSAELAELAQRAVTDVPWSDRIRAAARRRTLAHHTMRHRVDEMEAWWA